MSNSGTYRSVVHNLVATIQKQYGGKLSGDLDAALGAFAQVELSLAQG